jgi:hypothetical protein
MEGPKKIDFLFWEECPSHHQCYDRLEGTMREEGIAAPIVRTEITTDERAQEIGFPGSPTILVDGRDIDPPAGDVYYGLTCRTYRHEDGRISPLPSKETIRRGLLAGKNQQ